MKLGIVIPTLNEIDTLTDTVARLRVTLAAAERDPADTPIVVADCGSVDDTPGLARRLGCDLVEGERLDCRAAALNAGAARLGARVDVLWFVHADTLVPPDAVATLTETLGRPGVVGGTFDFAWRLDDVRPDQRLALVLTCFVNRVRFRFTRNFYGDQTLFVNRAFFEAVGGYADRALLEDIHISRALRKLGTLAIVPGRVLTSPRRFVRNGVIRQLLFDLVLLGADAANLQPRRLHRTYNGLNGERSGGREPCGQRVEGPAEDATKLPVVGEHLDAVVAAVDHDKAAVTV